MENIKKYSDFNQTSESLSVWDNEDLKKALNTIKSMKLSQQQFSTTEQLMWLRSFANALGLYDAVDYHKSSREKIK